MEFKEKEIRELWSNGKTLKINNKKYSVGKMSYGQYYLELSHLKLKETDLHDSRTLWLEKHEVNKNILVVV